MKYFKIVAVGFVFALLIWAHNLAVFQVLSNPNQFNSFAGFFALIIAVVIFLLVLRPNDENINKSKLVDTDQRTSLLSEFNRVTYNLIGISIIYSLLVMFVFYLSINSGSNFNLLDGKSEPFIQVVSSLIFAIIVDLRTGRFKDPASRISWYGAVVLLMVTLTQYFELSSI
ncbi:hypothetical protein [Flavilitoribacter nigricans]|uniref:Uncharacterized protein n=1 Tax=Flavilitoribacter nigricans (strain ATCC 23147 / DSM 23189 / NBRC 102662 / NCIMB 1420 / SS-2) TaxID=1122177 RepID=A0A2D0NCE2_FLAN2|nr:hypothetical protein [Flavilitoribacter nigricans]PHN06174.1 hypothetical protein CRP01_11355 [Flavilitoribacter nigricans DSM 23189 = NBRC 102662]